MSSGAPWTPRGDGATPRWVSITRAFDASPDRIYRMWSQPDELTTWLPRYIEGSLTVDTQSILTWHDRRIPIDVMEAEPVRIFRFRWRWLEDLSYITEVTVQLYSRGYGTLLTLTDGPFDISRPGVLDACAEALEGWGEALAWLRAQADFSVDLRPPMT